MQIYRPLLGLIVTLFLSLSALHGHCLTLNKNETGRQLSAEVSLLEDKSGELRIDDVRSPKMLSQFRDWTRTGNINLGFSDSVYWLKLSLARDESAPSNWLIEIPYLGLENIDFYAPDAPPVLTGAARPFTTRVVASRYFVFPIVVQTESRDYYIRLKSQYALTVPLSVWKPKSFYEDAQLTLTVQALYFGGLLALLVYNFFLWVSLKDLRFLLYTLFTSLLGLGIFAGNGFGRLFLWPDAADFDVVSQTTFISLAVTFAIEFAIVFMRGREVAPLSTRILHVAAVICGAVSVFMFASIWTGLHTTSAQQLFVITTMIATPLILWMGVCGWRQKVSGARFFLLAWCLLLGGGIVASLRMFSLMPTNSFTAYSVQISSAAEMLLLALALADSVRHERDERELAQRQALDSSQQLMQVLKESELRLEKAVEERTSQLNLSLANEKAVLAQYLRFGSLISHEFRNPLGIIDSQVALMRKELASGKSVDLNPALRLDAISGATQRLVKLFDQWLSDGQAKPDIRPMHIAPITIASWLVQLLHDNRMFLGSHLIETQLDSDITVLHADKELLDIALVNLLDNACKYSAPGSTIILSSSCKPGFIGISVTDHGAGIAAEHHENIFEQYFRIPSDDGARGSGLGLPFVKNIVNNHRGHIELTSQPGQGSTFTLWLPEPPTAQDNSHFRTITST